MPSAQPTPGKAPIVLAGLWTSVCVVGPEERPDRGGPARGSGGSVGGLFSVPEDGIQDITSVLTILGGRIVHGDAEFKEPAPPMPRAMPDWSPVNRYGCYQKRALGTAHRDHASRPRTADATAPATSTAMPMRARGTPRFRCRTTRRSGARSAAPVGRFRKERGFGPREVHHGIAREQPAGERPAHIIAEPVSLSDLHGALDRDGRFEYRHLDAERRRRPG